MIVVVTTEAVRRAKLLLRTSPPTNQYPTFYVLDAFSDAQPTVSKHWNFLNAYGPYLISWLSLLFSMEIGVLQLLTAYANKLILKNQW